MNIYVIFTICFYFINSCNSEQRENGTTSQLKSVVVIYRHGFRTPKGSFPNDPFFNKQHIPEGFGTLTNKGKLRQYNLGLWFRQRYSSFLSNTYEKDEIKMTSADHDFCLQSVECSLAGLYRPNPNQEWLSGLPWDPIPVHTSPLKDDYSVAMMAPCAKYDKLYEEVKKFSEFSDIIKKNEKFINFLSEKTGWDIQDIDYIRELHQLFYIYQNYNSSYIPAWAGDIDKGKFTELASLAWKRETFTPELKRLYTGPFFDNLFSYFDQIIAGKEVPKFLMMSSSIHAVTAVLNTMEVFDNHPVEFSDTVIWELSKNSLGRVILTMYYKRSESSQVEFLKLKGCESYACEYNTVKQLLKSNIVDKDTWVQDCKL